MRNTKPNKNIKLIALLISLLILITTLLIIVLNFYVLPKYKSYNLSSEKFSGNIYSINFPNSWKFEGPSEGPITGFPEYGKLISPSGDTQIYIGLRGDNRFEFASEEIKQNVESSYVDIGNKKYYAEEYFLDLNKDGEIDTAITEVEINDANFIGYREYSQEIFLPIKIQLLYGFTSDSIPYTEKFKKYSTEKVEALSIIKTFNLKGR